MVAPEPGAGTTTTEAVDGGTTFGKLRQTLSSSLLTAQDKGESAGHEYFMDVIVGWCKRWLSNVSFSSTIDFRAIGLLIVRDWWRFLIGYAVLIYVFRRFLYSLYSQFVNVCKRALIVLAKKRDRVQGEHMPMSQKAKRSLERQFLNTRNLHLIGINFSHTVKQDILFVWGKW